jgi:hypothetical protein
MTDTVDLTTVPQVVNIEHYAGDTLMIHIVATAEVIAGRTFFAQVRGKRGASKLDATFTVLPNATGVDLVLYGEDSQRLALRGPYTGFWDVQLAESDGSDPVTTLAHGELLLAVDVTRTTT